MSTSQHNESELEQAYLASVARELNLRKYPDTILIERIRQKYKIIADVEKIRKNLQPLFADKKFRDIEKAMKLYETKIAEFEEIFNIEQAELDAIKSIIREVPILITMLESATKHLPKVDADAPDNDKKFHKITLQELKTYLKEMKLLQTQRYKINLTIQEAQAINKKTKSVKNKLDKLMIAFEKKVEKFYDALSLMYKKARAKSRAKSKAKNKTKTKAKTKKSKKKLSEKAEKKSKAKVLSSMLEMRIGISDYVKFFQDTFSKQDKDFAKIHTKLKGYIPVASNVTHGKTITTLASKVEQRMMVNHDGKVLLHKLKSMQANFEVIKHRAKELIAQNDESEVHNNIDAQMKANSTNMLDESKHGTHLRTAVLNAVSEYINQQPVKDAALYDLYTPLAQIPALTDIDDITGIINETLENSRRNFDDKFIKILKNNLAHAFKTTPFRFEDAQSNTNAIVFDPTKGQELVNTDSVATALNERGSLLDKGAYTVEEYENLADQYIKLYKIESHNASHVSHLRESIKTSFEKLKVAAEPYLYDNNINLLLGHITHIIYLLENPSLPVRDADQKSTTAKGYLKQLTTAIDAAAEAKPQRNTEDNLLNTQLQLYNLIIEVLGSNPELSGPSQAVINTLDKQKLKLRYSASVGEVSTPTNLIALGGVARNSAEPVSPSKTKSVTLFSKSKSKSKRGNDFIALIGKLDKDFIKEESNLTQLIAEVKKFKKGNAPRP